MFAGIIIIRILFAACMVFIIGFVFGNFSKNAVLKRITKVASILAIVLFVAANIFLIRAAFWHGGHGNRAGYECHFSQKDSVENR